MGLNNNYKPDVSSLYRFNTLELVLCNVQFNVLLTVIVLLCYRFVVLSLVVFKLFIYFPRTITHIP